MRTYTVMLLYPDWMQDGNGHETYTHACRARNAIHAVELAKQEAIARNSDSDPAPEDFAVLTVMYGRVRFVYRFDCEREVYFDSPKKRKKKETSKK
jgi:hypothetical protein